MRKAFKVERSDAISTHSLKPMHKRLKRDSSLGCHELCNNGRADERS